MLVAIFWDFLCGLSLVKQQYRREVFVPFDALDEMNDLDQMQGKLKLKWWWYANGNRLTSTKCTHHHHHHHPSWETEGKCPNDSPLSNLFHKREDKVFPSLISSCMILIFVPITAPVSPIVWSFSPKAVCDPRRIWSFRLFCCFAPNLCCISSFVSILLFSVQLQNDKALQKHHKHLHLLKIIFTKFIRWLTF